MSRSLSDKKILLLGGTSGIGFATARAAALEGATVVVVSSQPEKVEHALSRLPDNSEGHVVDVTNETEQQAFFNRVGKFDHLIFTAGEALLIDSIHAMDSESARRFFNLRYWGAFTAAKYGSPNIRPGGSISFTSGVAAARPNPGLSVAAASVCGAIEAMTRALAVELRPLRVNAIAFGMIRTELWNHLTNEQLAAMDDSAAKTLLVGKLGEPEDAAEAFIYLMKEQYTTGQILVVDGGASLV